ncbi:MAG: TlpA disulfide reductase family protein [Polyangiaceae bacterium]
MKSSIAIGVGLVFAAGCDKGDAPTAQTSRSEAVLTTAAPAAAPSSAPHAAPSAPSTTAPPRKLCETELTQPGHALPKIALAHAEASGAFSLGDKIKAGGGRWTWVNFFAAWCGPCKEEIPRLRAWEQRLAKAGTPIQLVFVSLDDDERQLGKFLDAQPTEGVRSSLWLKSGTSRDQWLAGMKMKNPPDLPEHALIDGTGQVRCVLEGAVDESDYLQFAAIVKR